MVPLFNCPGYEWEQVIAIEAKRLRTDFENALARRFIANLGKLAEEFLVAMPFNNIQRGPHFEMNLIRAMSRMGNNILAYTRDFIRPDMALLGSEAYFPLAPLPTNATTAQAVFCGIDYRVLCQYFMPRLRDLLGPLAVPLPQPPGGVNFPPSLVAAAAHFQHIIVPALGIISPPNGVGRYN
ncbi:hypothetical protein HDU99_005595, partial [Rhizoclosmatium hyalinum]